MVKQRIKIINKSGEKEKLLTTIEKILLGEIGGLDIQPLAGKKGTYRCRIGKIRIVFSEKNGKLYIEKVGYRGDIYKNL